MKCPDYIGSQWHKDSQWWSRHEDVKPAVSHFGERLCREFAKLQIPLWVSNYPRRPEDSLEVSHCILGRDLPPLCWVMINHKAQEIADALCIEADWYETSPYYWELYNLPVGLSFEASGDPDAALAYLF